MVSPDLFQCLIFPVTWSTQVKPLLYLAVSGLDVQNVSLGGGPVEGEVRHSVAEGKWRLAVGQTHDIHWHLDCRKAKSWDFREGFHTDAEKLM